MSKRDTRTESYSLGKESQGSFIKLRSLRTTTLSFDHGPHAASITQLPTYSFLRSASDTILVTCEESSVWEAPRLPSLSVPVHLPEGPKESVPLVLSQLCMSSALVTPPAC